MFDSEYFFRQAHCFCEHRHVWCETFQTVLLGQTNVDHIGFEDVLTADGGSLMTAVTAVDVATHVLETHRSAGFTMM